MTTRENENENDPVKITEKLEGEILEEPIGSEAHILEPVEEVEHAKGEPEDEERFEETTDIETTKAQEGKPQPEKIRKTNGRSLSKLHSELRKHSDARKKTDLAVKDIKKQLKDLLLAHHSAIKDLQKQVTRMHIKIATIESRKSSSYKTRPKNTGNSKKSKKKSS